MQAIHTTGKNIDRRMMGEEGEADGSVHDISSNRYSRGEVCPACTRGLWTRDGLR
ncbi:protein of unknown function [Paenibacillus alvei]|uniref:Uncharacterized protein n=1 Tax=Paenibacillus alvei TaxID=44250 RepID=A0A383RJF6_PAEAL|nr:protein of unknown function [Paenibacillus alvei]